MEIKICGITREIEIEYINILKPDYIGFVFSKSIRQITKEKAKVINENLTKNIKSVAVFRNEGIDYVVEISNYLDIKIIQLHGIEDMNYVNSLSYKLDGKVDIWKAVSIINEESINEIKKYNVSKYLLDSSTPGEGKRFDLSNLNRLTNKKDIFIAGGVSINNVKEIIEKINPAGIDVSSGVEETNSIGQRYKSFEKMKKLIGEVKRYE